MREYQNYDPMQPKTPSYLEETLRGLDQGRGGEPGQVAGERSQRASDFLGSSFPGTQPPPEERREETERSGWSVREPRAPRAGEGAPGTFLGIEVPRQSPTGPPLQSVSVDLEEDASDAYDEDDYSDDEGEDDTDEYGADDPPLEGEEEDGEEAEDDLPDDMDDDDDGEEEAETTPPVDSPFVSIAPAARSTTHSGHSVQPVQPAVQANVSPPTLPPPQNLPPAPQSSDRPKPQPANAKPVNARTIQNLDNDLKRLKLGVEEREALLENARSNPEAASALLKLVGPASITHEAAAADSSEADDLAQEIAAGRETELQTQSIRFLHNEENESAVLARLREDANKLQVLERPLNLIEKPGEKPGQPRALGRVVAMSIWWFREIPRSSREQDKSRWKQYAGTALEFLNDILGRRTMLTQREDVPTDLMAGDYVAFELKVDVHGSEQEVYFLSAIRKEGHGVNAAIPSSPADTQYRFVQGLIDGFSVMDRDGNVTRYYDRLTYTPMILSRIRIPSERGKGDSCPADTAALRRRLEEEGLHLQCSGRYGAGPMWFLEPSWLAMGSGFRAVDTDMPQITPGTKDFANRLQSLRDRARRDIRSQGIPRHVMLRLMLAGGEANLDLDRVAEILRE